MKKSIVVVVFCAAVFALVIGHYARIAADNGCRIPNPSITACYDPDDRVASCTPVPYVECGASTAVRLYDTESFPDGTIPASSGATKTESANCWRWQGCIWDEEMQTCKQTGMWSVWRIKAKTVVNPAVPCPQS